VTDSRPSWAAAEAGLLSLGDSRAGGDFGEIASETWLLLCDRRLTLRDLAIGNTDTRLTGSTLIGVRGDAELSLFMPPAVDGVTDLPHSYAAEWVLESGLGLASLRVVLICRLPLGGVCSPACES